MQLHRLVLVLLHIIRGLQLCFAASSWQNPAPLGAFDRLDSGMHDRSLYHIPACHFSYVVPFIAHISPKKDGATSILLSLDS